MNFPIIGTAQDLRNRYENQVGQWVTTIFGTRIREFGKSFQQNHRQHPEKVSGRQIMGFCLLR